MGVDLILNRRGHEHLHPSHQTLSQGDLKDSEVGTEVRRALARHRQGGAKGLVGQESSRGSSSTKIQNSVVNVDEGQQELKPL
ncbi:hypothetical protein Pmani_004844 [Petrolisthes manimaculis]|uniref:Uncharacterized protein n=1 Tax=Petrolisthes manimaculis TaxID=1843537 RepID=A0AAE1UI25_9EUCA|nr:hypothetical protein Pmani_004844 [Petrolisthes manimaculis]